MNGTFYATVLIVAGSLLIWAGMTGKPILAPLAFGTPTAGQKPAQQGASGTW